MHAIDIFPWDDNFKTGLPEIDEQHQRLVALLNKLASHVAFRSNHIELDHIFDELIDYTVYHFKTEETIWHSHFGDNQRAIQHQATHAGFVDMVQLMRAQQEGKSLRQVAEEVLDFLVRWLASHILESDRFLAQMVIALQAGHSEEEAYTVARERMSGATRSMIDIILSIYGTLSRNTLQLMRKLVENEEAETALRHSQEALLLAKQRAESANRAKSQFLASISHEIRTPLHGVLGMAQLLQMPNLGEEERQEFVRSIIDSGNTLLAILNEVLDYANLDTGKMQLAFSSLSPARLLDDIRTLHEPAAQAKGLSFTTHWDGPTLRHYSADPLRLRQMIGHLVSNAIKFTTHGEIHLKARECPSSLTYSDFGETFARLRISVTDTGIGVPEEQIPQLFQPFTQLPGQHDQPGKPVSTTGTGLGLSIVRALAEMMDGTVGVESTPGQGSTFWFEVCLEVL